MGAGALCVVATHAVATFAGVAIGTVIPCGAGITCPYPEGAPYTGPQLMPAPGPVVDTQTKTKTRYVDGTDYVPAPSPTPTREVPGFYDPRDGQYLCPTLAPTPATATPMPTPLSTPTPTQEPNKYALDTNALIALEHWIIQSTDDRDGSRLDARLKGMKVYYSSATRDEFLKGGSLVDFNVLVARYAMIQIVSVPQSTMLLQSI